MLPSPATLLHVSRAPARLVQGSPQTHASALVISILLFGGWFSALPQAQWVHFATNGTLAYYADNMTNRLPDFSFAGYTGGGIALPTIPVKQTIAPVTGDNTANIQNAINAVSALVPDAIGFRGAVLLKAGTYTLAGSLTVSAGGVVLRGEGNNTNSGTVLFVTGLARNVIAFSGSGSRSQVGSAYTITDNYVPLGATNFHVSSAASFAVGNQIVLQRPQTQVWINAIGMSNYWTPGTGLQFERQITAIAGNQLTIDVPLCNPIEQVWATGQVYQVTDSGRIQQVGIENLCGIGQIDDYPSNILTGCFVVFSNLKNSWMHDVWMSGWGNGLSLNSGCKWCTIQDCQYVSPGTGTSSAAPAAYTIGDSDQMCLFHRCTSDGGYYHIMVTQAGTAGPNVFLNFGSSGTHYNGGPHQRWAAGALHDNIVMAADSQGGYTPYLAINNRAGAGSGQGWAAGFSLMYNCQVPQFQLEQPSVTNHYNWTIGGIGSTKSYSDNGIYDTLGTIVSPRSLYLEQLRERLGGGAVENIGYSLFTLATTPAFQVVAAGNGANYSITLGDTNGFRPNVSLSITGLPPGATAAFNPSLLTAPTNSTLTVSTLASTPGGAYTLSVVGTSGGVAHTNLIALQVGSFSMSATPPTQTVAPGGSTNFTLTVVTNSSFTGTVAFGLAGLPSDATAAFNPPSLSGSGSSTLSVSTTTNTPPGSFALSVTGTGINLTNTVVVTLNVIRGAANLVWAGTTSGLWDVTNSANWLNAATTALSPFAQGDSVLLDDTPGVTNTITIPVAVLPASFTNNSSANNFTIVGPGKISGATGLVKSGASTLTLSTSNDFTGTVAVLGGILKPANAAALGASSLTLTNGGTLDVNGLNLGAETVTVSGGGLTNGGAIINSGPSQTTALKLVTLSGDTTFGGAGRWDIRGSGASLMSGGQPWKITKVGTNQISLVAVSPIDSALGDIDIQQGTFAIQTTTTQVGDPTRTITVRSNATLDLWTLTASPLNKNLVLKDGATIYDEKAPSVVVGPVTLQGTCTFNTANSGTPPTLTFSNALSGAGSLNKIGAGTLALTAPNTYAGATLVTAGALALVGPGSISSSASINVSAGATLDASGRSDSTLSLASGQTLLGAGSILGNLIVGPAATVALGAGPTTIGTLGIGSAVTLQGTTYIKLSKAGPATNDLLQAGSSITFGGTLTVTNLAGTLQVGDSFKLFSAASYSNTFTTLVPPNPGPGLSWDKTSLLINGTLKVAVAPNPTITSVVQFGTNLLFAGTNGIPNGNYAVLASTNLSVPISDWLPLATNAFDSSGNFTCTNALVPGPAQRFYLLEMQ
jgi:autotransporter-associated beta strand protein